MLVAGGVVSDCVEHGGPLGHLLRIRLVLGQPRGQ